MGLQMAMIVDFYLQKHFHIVDIRIEKLCDKYGNIYSVYITKISSKS